jgi:predicted ABC-type sugar transport system permease subunit
MTVEQDTPVVAGLPKKNRATNLANIRKVWPWFFLALMVIVFTISAKAINGTNFISVRSVQGILTYATQIALIGLGETLILIAAGIDMSAGYMLGFSAVIAAEIMKALHAAGASPVVTILAGMLGGTLICIIPGYITSPNSRLTWGRSGTGLCSIIGPNTASPCSKCPPEPHTLTWRTSSPWCRTWCYSPCS